MLNVNEMREFVADCDVRPLFVTVSGAHLYGFDSPDSDIDLRGCHLLPLEDLVGLKAPEETYQQDVDHQGWEIDLVSHDVGKYLRLLVKNNGYILEQVFSPLVVLGQDFLDELRPLASRCVTRFHYHHYRGFYSTQRNLIEKQQPRKAKAILYAYRVLMTGIHLMKTGEVEANLPRLNESFRLSFIDDLIAQKTQEHIAANVDWDFHAGQLDALEAKLNQAFEDSTLPETRDRDGVNRLLVRLRLEQPS
ncbi:MAG: nucleotidyltransferase domain-containing protein [Planctomycetales bacterium]